MSVDWSAVVVVGIPLQGNYHEDNVFYNLKKFDQDTGEPRVVEVEKTRCFLGDQVVSEIDADRHRPDDWLKELRPLSVFVSSDLNWMDYKRIVAEGILGVEIAGVSLEEGNVCLSALELEITEAKTLVGAVLRRFGCTVAPQVFLQM